MYNMTITDEEHEKRFEESDHPEGAADISFVPKYGTSDDIVKDLENGTNTTMWGWYICDFEGQAVGKRLSMCPWCGAKIQYEY